MRAGSDDITRFFLLQNSSSVGYIRFPYGYEIEAEIKKIFLFLLGHSTFDPQVVEIMKLAALSEVHRRFWSVGNGKKRNPMAN